ncbi:response regulator transcription factor [Nocardia sp. NBC_01503]|uniref:response regulator transcription factor n=1 Tax=Nocardia sp. NBC_01503 TaxID=2975997 RepID=UPI002E7B761A|nr:response regulator transcription factor [Nocardia sp. NBC_01503]WTL30599.1 response regulator transcription factor [Nocardia sp. NBC_01503]
MIRIFDATDRGWIRQQLRCVIDTAPDLVFAGAAGSIGAAKALIPEAAPDVVLLAACLADGDGIDLCAYLRSRVEGLRCVLLADELNVELMVRAVRAGAASALPAEVSPAELNAGIRGDHTLLDERLSFVVVQAVRSRARLEHRLSGLTVQQRGLLTLIGTGASNREIAAQLFLSEKSVRNNVSRLLARLGMRSRREAVLLAGEVAALAGGLWSPITGPYSSRETPDSTGTTKPRSRS